MQRPGVGGGEESGDDAWAAVIYLLDSLALSLSLKVQVSNICGCRELKYWVPRPFGSVMRRMLRAEALGSSLKGGATVSHQDCWDLVRGSKFAVLKGYGPHSPGSKSETRQVLFKYAWPESIGIVCMP